MVFPRGWVDTVFSHHTFLRSLLSFLVSFSVFDGAFLPVLVFLFSGDSQELSFPLHSPLFPSLHLSSSPLPSTQLPSIPFLSLLGWLGFT